MRLAQLVTIAILSISANANASSYVMCHLNSFSATHSNQPVNVSSTHDVVITNTTDSPKNYHVQYKTLINKKVIHIVNIDVTIKSGGTFQESKLESSAQTFPKKVNLDASCQTTVWGYESNDIKGGGNIVIN